MKYEPVAEVPKNFWAQLMQPFAGNDTETDWELVDIVSEAYGKLDAEDQEVLHEVFYMRSTYEETATNIGIKAKSHAWRKTQKALENLKEQLENNSTFRRKYGSQYLE